MTMAERLNADFKRALDEHALVSISDVTGKIIFANEKFCKISGYSEAELLGRDHDIVNSGYHEPAYIRQMWRTIAQGKTWQGEFRNRRKDGSHYWVDTTIIPFLDDAGKPYQYVSVRRDITDLKEAQMCAQRLGERLQRLLDASPSVVYAHENPRRLKECTFVSGNVSDVVGFSVEQMLADPDFWLNHLHPSDRPLAKTQIGRLLEQGRSTVEYRFLTAQGQYRWICDNARVVRDSQGGLQAIVGSWTDITDRKTVELERLRLLMAAEASADMVFLTNAEEVIEYANPAFCQFTGWEAAEILGKRANILASGKTPAAVYEAMQETLRQGKPWRGRLLNQRKKGSPLTADRRGVTPLVRGLPRRRKDDPVDIQADPSNPLLYWAEVSITPILDEAGNNLGYVSFQRDISATVLQEERLALKRLDTEARLAIVELLNQSAPLAERFGQVMDRLFALPDMALQKKGGIFLRNKETDTLEMFLLRGEFSEEFVRREHCIPLGACLCGRAAASGELLVSNDCFCDPRHEHRFEGMANHGHYIVPLVSGSEVLGVLFLYTEPCPNFSADRIEMLKQIGEYMAFAIDRNQTRKMVEQARDAALGASRQKSEFLANMSHEIRTPMNGVLGMLELLRRTPLTHEQQEFADTAAHSAETLLIIINSILDFSRIEAGKLDLDCVNFDLRELIEEVCALLAAPAFAKGLELNCFVEPRLPAELRGDPMHLRQVMTNLIGNAIKFTPRGEVGVEVVCLSQDDFRAVLKFMVRDTGIGISPENRERLFRPFEQADGATTRRFGGTGLGLSISKSLIAHMGGSDIYVESTPGIGSTFWFTVCLEKQRQGVEGEPVKTLARRKVLVVDDNATNRTILLRLLGEWGAKASAAEDAFQALQMLRDACTAANPFELAILDMNMPDMDGLMLARVMQQEEDLANMPRILLSSGGAVDEGERAKAGIRQSMTKPVRQSVLFDAVVSALGEAWSKPKGNVMKAHGDLPVLSGQRVLLVEDNPVNQRVAMKMLECFDVSANFVGNGREALAELERWPYDLVLMDCHMPEMDGYAATRALRERERIKGLPRIPVIALTANALEGDRERCLEAGMDDHLGKPFMLDGLAQTLSRWLAPASVPGQAEVSDPGEPLWDAEVSLSRLGGDVELLAEMRQLFVKEAPKQLAQLRLQIPPTALSDVGDMAHALKGMALHFCARRVVELAAGVEHKARAGGDDAPTGEQILQLVSAVESLVEALRDTSGN